MDPTQSESEIFLVVSINQLLLVLVAVVLHVDVEKSDPDVELIKIVPHVPGVVLDPLGEQLLCVVSYGVQKTKQHDSE